MLVAAAFLRRLPAFLLPSLAIATKMSEEEKTTETPNEEEKAEAPAEEEETKEEESTATFEPVVSFPLLLRNLA